jgi:hypothetical protein
VGVIDAAIAALLKALTDITARAPLRHDAGAVLHHRLGCGCAAAQPTRVPSRAISASLPAIATINPLLSIAVGVLVYDDTSAEAPAAAPC